MHYDKAETMRALELLEQRLREFEVEPGPTEPDPIYLLWQRHLQIMREEAATLRLLLETNRRDEVGGSQAPAVRPAPA
ncbi:MAG: hypothetical protein JWP65_894 [Ramlibacter sp.]|jgi:hypothetical protein|uniref:hypothetical protein n=1 Tax=Ramlibacter sp. TaxID=1917967 RepID=UPI00261FC8AF|nr:hypothetical protein [Ramlibacter sp.]MDB5750473.1 hypothetical protein [Ramlibacter sp.]